MTFNSWCNCRKTNIFLRLKNGVCIWKWVSAQIFRIDMYRYFDIFENFIHYIVWGGRTALTFIVGQQIEESLSNFLPCEWLSVLQAVQQRAYGVVLSLSVHRSHPVPVRELTFSQEVQDVPLDGNRITGTNPHKNIFLSDESYHKNLVLV